MSSIAVVVTFFGSLPIWLPAFLRSCRHNLDVQWLIYGDSDIPFSIPSNVTFRRLSLDEFNSRASDALATRICIEPAGLRKLCDFKPAYGLMFADDLRPFDWWAYSDLDIVWGDIRRFVSDEILREHDIISSRRHKLSGHFTLLRNTDETNRAFELIADVRAHLCAAVYLRLDERMLSERLRVADRRVYWDQELTLSAEYQKALPDDASLWWIDGRTYDAHGREVMYLHFHKLKSSMASIDFRLEELPTVFAINRHGIFAGAPLGV